MSNITGSDNIYSDGAFVTAKENPTLKLKIIKILSTHALLRGGWGRRMKTTRVL